MDKDGNNPENDNEAFLKKNQGVHI